MSTSIVIRDFRLSFIYTELCLEVISGKIRPTPGFAFLSQGNIYKDRFESVQAPRDPLGLQPPWREGESQRFWKRYLPGAVLDAVSGRQAWERLVPVRSRLPLAVKGWARGQVLLEGFYYPHGLALLITVKCQEALTLSEVVKLAYAIRRSERFSVQNNQQRLTLNLRALSQRALDSMRSAALAPTAAKGVQREPFTLFTVVRAEGDGLTTEVATNGDIHNALEAITEWPPDPAAVTLPSMSDVSCLPLKLGIAKGSLLYAHQRGRVVWFPGLFTSQDKTISSLACYHRNHLFGSMQVDSLGGVVAGTAAWLRNGMPLSALARPHWTCARNACECLETIYGGDKRLTYRSQSLKRQIQQNDLADLNELRRAFAPGIAVLT